MNWQAESSNILNLMGKRLEITSKEEVDAVLKDLVMLMSIFLWILMSFLTLDFFVMALHQTAQPYSSFGITIDLYKAVSVLVFRPQVRLKQYFK